MPILGEGTLYTVLQLHISTMSVYAFLHIYSHVIVNADLHLHLLYIDFQPLKDKDFFTTNPYTHTHAISTHQIQNKQNYQRTQAPTSAWPPTAFPPSAPTP